MKSKKIKKEVLQIWILIFCFWISPTVNQFSKPIYMYVRINGSLGLEKLEWRGSYVRRYYVRAGECACLALLLLLFLFFYDFFFLISNIWFLSTEYVHISTSTAQNSFAINLHISVYIMFVKMYIRFFTVKL